MFHSSSSLFLFPFSEKITEIGEKLSEWLPGGGGETISDCTTSRSLHRPKIDLER